MRSWFRTLLGLACIAGLSGPVHAGDIAAMQPSEIEALQKRLTDAKCYAGPVDGKASEALTQGIAACPPQDPQLRVETGMHAATINRLSVNRSCSMIATGSDDKTVRLWSLPDGDLLRILRVPIAAGNNGRIYAVALSPDGRFVAAGGWDGAWEATKHHAVYIFNTATGDLVARVGAFEDVIDHLVFSPDGRWLAATLGSGSGLRLFDTAQWTEAFSDKALHTDSYGAAFGPDGRLYTVSYDGKLRRYGPGPAFRKDQDISTKGGTKPFSVAVDPSGKFVAVGFSDSTKVDVYDAASLAFRVAADTKGVNSGNLDSVAWLADGGRILAGGQYPIDGASKILTFGQNGRRIGAGVPVSDITIMNIQPCAKGFVVAAADPAFGLLDADSKKQVWKSGVIADMRNKLGDAFTVSGDGKRIRFGLGTEGKTPVAFDVMAATMLDAPTVPAGFAPPRITGLPVTNWQNELNPALNGKPLKLDDYERARSFVVRPDLTGFALGSEYGIRAYDTKGEQLWRQYTPGVAWGVNFSADGRIIVAAYADGTIRWHRWTDGQELLALFVNRDTRAWVAWTPSGYYMASPGGEDMIGWHLNRGWEQAADFFPASRFRDKFNRPDIVGFVLDTLDEAQAISRANTTAKRRDIEKPIIERLPPVITIVSPIDGTSAAPGAVDIHYSTRSPSGAKVDHVEAFVDGAKVSARGFARTDDVSGTISLAMPAHDATISLVAYADGLASDAVKIGLRGKNLAQPAEADILKPTLYALLIGVTHYENAKYDLGYPADDANALAAALQGQKGKLYKDVVVRVLTDKEATTTAVKRGLTWLRKQTTAHDLAIVFAAGHGTTDAKGKFWFLTYDMDPDDISATAVSRDDISDVLFDLPGRKLLFLDACHSGAALNAGARGGTDISAAVSDFAQAEGGVVAYAASTGREFSFEREEWGHGAFTKALIEGFEGKADILHKGTVTTATLDLFLEDRVKELTGGQQHPVMTRPKTVPDFPIALAQ